MLRIAPFRGVIYNPKKVRDFSKVVAPPYDVISPEEQARLYKKSPQNVVRLILNQETNPYEEAARTFEQWQAEGVMVQSDQPAIYFLSQRFTLPSGKQKERLGFIALTRLEDPAEGSVHPHENTFQAPRDDRMKLLQSCKANLSPIFSLYSDPRQTITEALEEHVSGVAPTIEVKEDGKGSSTLWQITDPEVIGLVQRQMNDQPLLIADGHHRFEAAMNYRNLVRAEQSQWTGVEACNFVMMYFSNMTEDGLVILPTHRLVRDFDAIPFLQLEETIQKYFNVDQYPKTQDGRRSFLQGLQKGGKKQRLIGASFKGDPRYLILRLKNKKAMQNVGKGMSPALLELDVSILHLLILEQILGLSAERQVLGDTMSYPQDEEAALKEVEKGEYKAAFILGPPRAQEILDIALGGEKMPQKSTYFYPKLLSGLVINKIDSNEQVNDEPGSSAVGVDH
ncbi:MAG: DUF1015 family protein [Deltaproteobacteria bacterium]|nr:DUF1015 family protein [Deltaproteobacteria bacterium]